MNDYGVSLIEYFSAKPDELDKFAQNGWKCNRYKRGFKAMPPRISLCDLADLHKVMQYDGDAVLNFSYTSFLNNLLASGEVNDRIDFVLSRGDYDKFCYHIARGEVLGDEIKISGSDLRIHNLKDDLIRDFRASPEYFYLNEQSRDLGIRNRELLQHRAGEKTCELFDRLEIHAKILSRPIQIPRENFAADTSELAKTGADFSLFVPYGCFKFLSNFIDDHNCDQAIFSEMHLDHKRIGGAKYELFSQDLHDRKVFVIDSVYSGGTISLMKNYVTRRGGTPILVGVNPKSADVMQTLDFAQILDKVYDTKSLGEFSQNIFRDFYVKTFSKSKEGL